MKKTLYLLRHGEPAFPDGKRTCLSRADLPLSALGRMQGVLLKHYFQQKSTAALYHSSMTRARETASYIAPNGRIEKDFSELGVGVWEGMTFTQIRATYPELYAMRGLDPYRCIPPEGEWPHACLSRARATLHKIAASITGDAVIVAHAGVNRLLLCSIMDMEMTQFLRIPQPYGCINTLVYEAGHFSVQSIAERPQIPLNKDICEELLEAYGTPMHIRRHCRAVAKKALDLSEGLNMDTQILYSSAMLHDIARTQKNHARFGAELLSTLGYAQVGAVIEQHHELKACDEDIISEKTLLYLADKLVRHEQEATLEERFSHSSEKAISSEAKAAHTRRRQQADRVYDMIINHSIGGTNR